MTSPKTNTAVEVVRTKPRRLVNDNAQVEDVVWQLVPTKRRILAAVPQPIVFDVDNKKHREAFAAFLMNGKWPEGLRFLDEWPHTSAVTTIQTKLMHYALRKELTAMSATKVALSKASTKTAKVVVINQRKD